jgi:hypothetical protein
MKANVDPAKTAEAEALAWTIDHLRSFQGLLVNPPVFENRFYPFIDPTVDFVAIMALVEGNEGNVQALREVAARLISENRPLPFGLQLFIGAHLKRPGMVMVGHSCDGGKHTLELAPPIRRRGVSSSERILRNLTILSVMKQIIEKWKFYPTRSSATEHPSAASTVHSALAQMTSEGATGIYLTEKAVNKIWEARPKNKT